MRPNELVSFEPTDAFSNQELLDSLDLKAQNFFKSRPQPNEFIDKFGGETIKSDQQIVEKIRETFEKSWDKERKKYPNEPTTERLKEISDIVEYITAKQLGGAWFADKADAFPASEYDDFVNGIDTVLEYHGETGPSKYLGLGIDLTFSSNEKIVREKLDKIWNGDTRDGKPGKVKYFKSYDYKGALQLPRAVFILDPQKAKEIMRLEAMNDQESLDNHSAQVVLIYQLQTQFVAYYKRALARNHTKLAEMYENAIERLNSVIEEKQELLEKYADILSDDRGAQIIYRYFKEKDEQKK